MSFHGLLAHFFVAPDSIPLYSVDTTCLLAAVRGFGSPSSPPIPGLGELWSQPEEFVLLPPTYAGSGCGAVAASVPGSLLASFLSSCSREEDPDDVPHGHITSLVRRAHAGSEGGGSRG